MKKLPIVVEAQPVIHGVLKVAFDDGYERRRRPAGR